jgi:hypothetical protein
MLCRYNSDGSRCLSCLGLRKLCLVIPIQQQMPVVVIDCVKALHLFMKILVQVIKEWIRHMSVSDFSLSLRIWIQQWDTASTSNVEILELFQSKVLRMIVDASWYVPNTVIRRFLQTPTVKEEIRHYSSQYSARLSGHPNDLVVNLMAKPENRRLRRHLPNDLPARF